MRYHCKQHNKKSGTRGFIALTSVLIISAILIVLMFTVSTSSFYARFDALGGENKRMSLALAESCVNVALLALATSTQPSTYSPTNQVVVVGKDLHGQMVTCTIQSIGHSGQTVTIDTQASYHGSYSNVTARATVPDPAVGTLVPPPTCALSASPMTVPSGQNVLLQWGTANGTTFSLDHAIGTVTPTDTGSRSVSTSGQGAVTYIGTIVGPGGSTQCEVTFMVAPPPPAPSCADTVIMMDRTGSMTGPGSTPGTDMYNERTASKLLVDLYKGVTSFPKIGAGSFPGYNDGSWASVPVSPYGQLPVATPILGDYDTLKNTIDTLTANTTCSGNCGTNIYAAIMAGYNELNSVRSTKPKKVLILVSDGEANRTNMPGSVSPSDDALSAADTAKVNGIDIFTVRYSQNTQAAGTLLLAQLASGSTPVPGHLPGANDNSLNTTTTADLFPGGTHTPSNWTNPGNAQANDALVAVSSTNGQQQGYSGFGFGVPSGATIAGIEAEVNGYSGPGPTNTPNLAALSTGNYDLWSVTPSGSVKSSAVATNNGNTSYISETTVNEAQTFSFQGAAVPAGATINSVSVTAVASSASGAPSIAIRAERGFGPTDISDSASSVPGPGTGYVNVSRLMNTNPLTGSAWTLAEVNAWTTRFGVVKTNSTGTVRVTQLFVVVNYTPATGGTCQIGLNLSWNNGGSYTSTTKTVTLGGTQSSTFVGGAGDTWGRTWSSSEMSNANFVARVTNTSCSGGTSASLNFVRLRVTYAGYDVTVENNDGDNYYITPVADLASIQTIFDTIGRRVCPAAAAQCGNGVDDDGDGLIDSADPMCHVGNVLSGAYDATKNDEYEHPAPPPPPTAPAPPPPINLGSWEEIPQ